MTIIMPEGLGGSADTLVTGGQYLQLGASTLLYVDSQTGSDSNSGTTREQPKATVSNAYINTAAGGTIVCLAGHHEDISSVVTFVNPLTLVGEGSSDGKPAVTFTAIASGINTFSVTTNNVAFRNIRFLQSAIGQDQYRIKFTNAQQCRVSGCWFDIGDNDRLGGGIELTTGSGLIKIIDSTFVNVLTSVSGGKALTITAIIDDIEMVGCTIDGGTKGWANYGVDLTPGTPNLRLEAMSLLHGSLIGVGTGAFGYAQVTTATGGARVAIA